MMVFDGLRRIFNKLGNVTVDSSRKVGEGVQVPADRIGKIRPPRQNKPQKQGSKEKTDRKKELKERITKSQDLKKESTQTKPYSRTVNTTGSPRTIKKLKTDKDEIELFKELIDKKYDRRHKEEDEKRKDTFREASLEEILKEESKESLDPKLILIIGGISFAIVFVVVLALGFGFEIGLIFGALILMMAIFFVFLPSMQKGRKSSEASRELPFALRQMATELRAGIGLNDSMRSIALSGYGPLSEEFARTLEEIRYGDTTEKALLDMSERINSDGLRRAVYQITRTLNSGGDLAKTLSVIADDTAYELRMKLKDYSQKLNAFTMIYMFVAVLGPVITMIMLIAASTVMGAILPPTLLLILYLLFFPAVVLFMAFMIKRLEPQV
jgi:archaeal flagellar protein FlaJ